MNCVKLNTLSPVRLNGFARGGIGIVVAFGDLSIQEENEVILALRKANGETILGSTCTSAL